MKIGILSLRIKLVFSLMVISIDPDEFELKIVSDPEGIITRPCEMAKKHNAFAAINGGFFAFPDTE